MIGSRLPPPTTPARARGVQPNDDPYPKDCAAIRGWLKQRYGEVEIKRWGRRTTVNVGDGDTAFIDVYFSRPGGRTIHANVGVNGWGGIESTVESD